MRFHFCMSGFQNAFGSRKSSSVLTSTGLPLYFSNVIPLSFEMAIDCTWLLPADV